METKTTSPALRHLARCLLLAALPLWAAGCPTKGESTQSLSLHAHPGEPLTWKVQIPGAEPVARGGEGAQPSAAECQAMCLPEDLCPGGACDLLIDACQVPAGDGATLECTGRYAAE